MAMRFCTRCGKEIVVGKSFCESCDPVMPVTAAPPASTAATQPTGPMCARCCATLAPGKRFCRQCGLPVEQSAAAGESMGASATEPTTLESAAVAEPAATVCSKCGAALVSGKRFCRQCGQAVDAAGPANSNEPSFAGSGVLAAVATPLPDVPPSESAIETPDRLEPGIAPPPLPSMDATTEVEPDIPHVPTSAPTAAEASNLEPIPGTLPGMPISTVPDPRPEAVIRLPAAHGQSKESNKSAIGIGAIAATIVFGLVGGWLWHVHAHRSAISGASSQSQTVVATPLVQESGDSAKAEQVPKPPAGTSETQQSGRQQISMDSAPKVPSKPAMTYAPTASAAYAKPSTAESATLSQPPAPLTAPSVAPRSGVLHYHGPPVPYNGEVTFDHLPAARLKFTFDHNAWSLTIKPNSDGTKRVTLISLAQDDQTNCDLSWEVIQ
jgi:hypothetical protein